MTLESEARAASTALTNLHRGLEYALSGVGSAAVTKEDIVAATQLILEMEPEVAWCLGALLESFRGLEPQPYWHELAEPTQVADSTLHNRLKTWRLREANTSTPC